MTLQDRAADFADFGGWTFLNCAYHGPMPKVAAKALAAAVELRQNPARLAADYHFSFPDAYRDAIAPLIGAAPDTISLTDSTTQGMMLLANGLDWQPGDEVIIPRGEFPANRHPWLHLGRRGVVLREVTLDGGDTCERIAGAFSSRTRLVSVSWVRFMDGRRLDLAPISRLCRERGVLFAVDGSQGVGGLPLDLAATPCDLLACSGYKWLLGPYGLGFVHVEPTLGERLELDNVNWFGVEGAEDFNRLADLPLVMGPGARRFDANETANFFNVAAGTAAARYLGAITPAAVAEHCQGLHARLIEGLPAGFSPLVPGDAALRSNILCVKGADEALTARAFALAKAQRVAVSSREGFIRVSPHVYNTTADIDRLLGVLAEAAGAQRPRPARPALPRGPAVASSGPAALPRRVVLSGPTVSLRPLALQRDLEDLYAGAHGDAEKEAVWTYLPYGPFADRAAMAAWLATVSASTDPLFFAVADRERDRCLGMVSFLAVEPDHRSIEVGHIWYLPSHQRTQVNTEAVYLLLREAFELGYRRVEWKCDALNGRSRRAALRLGFRFEGIFRQHRIVKGCNRDTAWFSMLDGEWPEAEARLRDWLATPAAGRPSLGAATTDLEGRLQDLLGLRP